MSESGKKTAISLDQIKKISKELEEQRGTILKVYNSKIKKALESSSSCLIVSGLDYGTIIDTIDTTFKKIDKRFRNLTDVLDNGIYTEYSNLQDTLIQMFGSSFANQLSDVLGLDTLVTTSQPVDTSHYHYSNNTAVVPKDTVFTPVTEQIG